MIYLNNAATSFPKPSCVVDAVQACLKKTPASQFRDSATKSFDGTQRCRQKLGELLDIKDTERIYFTSGATESLNTLINGLEYLSGRILTTQTEHNSVLRPLMNQERTRGLVIDVLPCTAGGCILPETVREYAAEGAAVLFVNHCSNVTGYVQNLEEIVKICHEYHIPVIADISQSAGSIPVFVDKWKLDGVAFTGHKGLFGMRGIGGFYLRKGISLKPLKYGGTGRDSSQLIYKEDFEYEAGTQNQPGIESMLAGISYITELGQENILKKEQKLMEDLFCELEKISGVTVYGKYSGHQGPVMSFNINGLLPSDVAYILQNVYDITVRTGLHCAPLIHKAVGTEKYGTVRVSISYFTEEEDIESLLKAVTEIAASTGG